MDFLIYALHAHSHSHAAGFPSGNGFFLFLLSMLFVFTIITRRHFFFPFPRNSCTYYFFFRPFKPSPSSHPTATIVHRYVPHTIGARVYRVFLNSDLTWTGKLVIFPSRLCACCRRRPDDIIFSTFLYPALYIYIYICYVYVNASPGPPKALFNNTLSVLGA